MKKLPILSFIIFMLIGCGESIQDNNPGANSNSNNKPELKRTIDNSEMIQIPIEK